MIELDIQAALDSRDCLTPNCQREADNGGDYCRVCVEGRKMHEPDNWLDGLPGICVGVDGRPMRIRVDRPIGNANRRLMDFLGVEVETGGPPPADTSLPPRPSFSKAARAHHAHIEPVLGLCMQVVEQGLAGDVRCIHKAQVGDRCRDHA